MRSRLQATAYAEDGKDYTQSASVEYRLTPMTDWEHNHIEYTFQATVFSNNIECRYPRVCS
jgi:hypothetical protein